MNNPNFVKHIKEQYPPGTRIKLEQMQDPYHPVPPGTMGTVDMVDDAGQLHMKWDNGRTLALIPGEDSFSVVRQELTQEKLYMPLHCDLYERNEYGDMEEYPYEMGGREVLEYAGKISAAIGNYSEPEEKERGLMHWYGKDDAVSEKVRSAVFSVEQRASRLWGIVKLELTGELDAAETTTLLDYLTGQAADGWGEGFEQQDIQVDGGSILNAHLWASGKDWKIMTESEFAANYEQTQTPVPDPQISDMSY